MAKIKLADVARAAGVSQGTASNVFNRPDKVRAELCDKVRAVAAELGYAGPDPAGRMLRGGKARAIGMIGSYRLADLVRDPYMQLFLSGVGEVCDRVGAGLSLISSENRDTASWSVRSALVDGFIIHCLEDDDPLIPLARERRLPLVLLDHRPHRDACVIRTEDRQGAYAAARHLLDFGHRHIAILALNFRDDGRVGLVDAARRKAVTYPACKERLAGFEQALGEAGVVPVGIVETDNDPPTIERGLDALRAHAAPPTAILCMSDVMAIHAAGYLRDRGLDVPKDLSLTGFDDLPEAAWQSPPLTTVRQPIQDKGRMAAGFLLEEAGPPMTIVRTRLIQRGSTAPPRPRRDRWP